MPARWSADYYVDVYELARAGMPKKQLAKALGIDYRTLNRWMQIRPALRRAYERGFAKSAGHRDGEVQFSFKDYVYQHLPPNLQPIWDELMACEQEGNHQARIDGLLKDQGVRARQHLFIHSLVDSNFNTSRSLRRLGIPRRSFEDWRVNDPEFAELMDQIHEFKKDFFENAFIGRVAAGDTLAILHAARTQLRDRGYNEKVELVMQHEHKHSLEVDVQLEDLNLPLDVRRQVLEAIREQQAGANVIETTAVEALPA
jgi:hypothetical protein